MRRLMREDWEGSLGMRHMGATPTAAWQLWSWQTALMSSICPHYCTGRSTDRLLSLSGDARANKVACIARVTNLSSSAKQTALLDCRAVT